MDEDLTPSSNEQSGSQSQVPAAEQVSAEVDGFTITSASAVAPQTEESLRAAIALETEAPDAGSTRSPDAEAAAAETTPPPAEKPGPPQPKKKSGEERHDEIQARINAATRELREAERRTEALRAEAARLTPPPSADLPAISARPRWKDYEEQGKSYNDYEEDLATWDEQRDQRQQQVVEQRLNAQRDAERLRHAQAAYEARCDDARAKHPDWDDTIKANLNDVPQTPFLTAIVQGHPQGAEIFYEFGKNPDVAKTWAAFEADPAMRPTAPIFSALQESAHPSLMLEHLASHPDEYVRIARMAPVSALLALGKLETALGAKNGSPKRPISHAAAPLSHRAGSQQRGGTTSATDDDLDIEDYVRTINKREGRYSPV